MNLQNVLRVKDHEGGIVHEILANDIWTLNWGGRNVSKFDLDYLPADAAEDRIFIRSDKTIRNPSYYVDYQGCKFLTHRSPLYPKAGPLALCSGVATSSTYNLGGISTGGLDTMLPLTAIPIPMVSAKGVAMTENPCDASVTDDGWLWMYGLPDQHNSALYVYEAQPDSPFEFGGIFEHQWQRASRAEAIHVHDRNWWHIPRARHSNSALNTLSR